MAGVNPRDAARNPDYYAARKKINQHLWRHHQQARIGGTLSDRLEYHDDLHWHGAQLGRPSGHTHAVSPDGETPQATAERYWEEGQRGQTNE